MDYEKLKEVIAKKIKENGRGEITGPVLQAVLMVMVDSLGEVYPQTYTDEQKAQARANIDALANYDGEITKEKLSSEVQAILNDVANKQNITDESLATIAKTIVGAINEVYKGGLEDASIATNKIEDGAVTTEKVADNSITMEKLKKAQSSFPDIGMAVFHALIIELKNNNQTGSAILSSVGVNYTEMIDIHVALERIVRTLGAGVTIQVDEYDDEGFNSIYLGTVVGFNSIDDEISAIVRSQVDPSKDYFVVINTENYEFTTKICLTDQLPKIASLETDVTTLNGRINTNVKIIDGDTDLNDIKNYGLYLLSAGHLYYNYPFSDGASGSYNFLNEPSFMIVSQRYQSNQASQVVLSISNSIKLPLARNRYYDGTKWTDWTDDKMYEIWKNASEVVDKQNKQDTTLETTSKEVVGAINELFKGGVKNNSITTEKLKDQAVEYAKLSASIRSTLDMIGTNVKVLSSGTDLKKVTEAGVYILSGTATYLNEPKNWEHYNTSILIVTGDNSNSYNQGKTIIGFQDGSRYPFAATLRNNEWIETDLDTALGGKLDTTSTLTDTEINNIWDNN